MSGTNNTPSKNNTNIKPIENKTKDTEKKKV